MKRARDEVRRTTMNAVVLVCLVSIPPGASGADRQWLGAAGNLWNEPLNWNPSGLPLDGDNVFLTFNDDVDREVHYVSGLNPAPLLGNLRIDATGPGTITLAQATIAVPLQSDWLRAEAEIIGDNGHGSFLQTGGAHTIKGGLTLGNNAGSTGTYRLSGTGALTATGGEYLGSSGSGTFNQTGGTNTMGELTLGEGATGQGTYALSGAGELTVKNNETVGQSGEGTFTQTGGTHTIKGGLRVGTNAGSTGTFAQSGGTTEVSGSFNVGTNAAEGTGAAARGTFTLSGTGSLKATSENIGSRGSGTFTQSGGTNTVTGNQFHVGRYAGATGGYELSGGELAAVNEYVGGSGTGTFNQSAGTNTLTGTAALTVGNYTSGAGTYRLSGTTASLSAATETIGNYGTGTFTQTGGTNTAGTLTIKAKPNGHGTYDLAGGTLNVTNMVNNGQFNYSGGVFSGAVSNNAGATFTLSGAGTRRVQGDMTNNGTVKVTGTTEGTTALFTGTFTNNGVLDSDPAHLEFLDDLIVGPGGSIRASAGDQYILHQDFLINKPQHRRLDDCGSRPDLYRCREHRRRKAPFLLG